MPRFNSQRDVRLFKHYATEMVDDVIQTSITFWKLNVEETKFNLYGESLSKQYYLPIDTYCLIEREDTETKYEGFGSDTGFNSKFRFNRHTLEDMDFYPQIGDIVEIPEDRKAFFEITNVREDQWIGGQTYNNFSIICESVMVRRSSLDMEQFIR